MTRFPDAVIGIRQAVATGRVSDAISDDGVGGYTAGLRYRTDRAEGSLPLVFSSLANGWFAAHLASGSLGPELSGAGQVDFVLTVTAPGYLPAEQTLRVPGHRFAVEEIDIEQVRDSGSAGWWVPHWNSGCDCSLPRWPCADASSTSMTRRARSPAQK